MTFAQCMHDFTTAYGLPASLFLAGLVGGFTHCAGMCAPFVLAQAGDAPQKLNRNLLLPYHLGRMTTYAGLAALTHSIVNLAFLFSGARAVFSGFLLMLAASVFLITAFPRMAVFFPWAVKIQNVTPFKIFKRIPDMLLNGTQVWKRYILGTLLGFMPCGLVASALLATSTAPTLQQAVFSMVLFTAGTMPALTLVTFGGNTIRRKYPRAGAYLSRVAMTVSAVWLFTLAGFMIF